jgi:hypothetical protein
LLRDCPELQRKKNGKEDERRITIQLELQETRKQRGRQRGGERKRGSTVEKRPENEQNFGINL